MALLLVAVALAGCDRTSEYDAVKGTPPPKNPSHDRYAVHWLDTTVPPRLTVGALTPVLVRAKNTSDWDWLDPKTANPSKADGSYAVRLTYRWLSDTGALVEESGARGELTAPVPADGIGTFAIQVAAPRNPGSYRLEFDLIQELVTFFSSRGGEKLSVVVTVE